jgi:hypothetical protein
MIVNPRRQVKKGVRQNQRQRNRSPADLIFKTAQASGLAFDQTSVLS